ncbi:MAG TPA: hypothetical protein VK633_08240, partial [Verrucomicrobiae bacterium]|nr:hypothetical protein [Verrucomicrobiae bacterium]
MDFFRLSFFITCGNGLIQQFYGAMLAFNFFFALLLSSAISAGAASPAVTIVNGAAKVEAAGAPGELVTIEASSALNAPWDLLGSLFLTNNSVQWPDLWTGASSRRFYRVTRSGTNEWPIAPNFRLIDHLGKSRELYYYWGAQEITAFVLVFTATGCAEV